MGGHHGEPFKVPHWTTHSNWERSPHLVAYQKRLERLGLRDPWIRNYWPFFNPDNPHIGVEKKSLPALWKLLKPGLIPGLILSGSIIVLEEAYSKLKYGHTSWTGHWAEHHHEDGHH